MKLSSNTITILILTYVCHIPLTWSVLIVGVCDIVAIIVDCHKSSLVEPVVIPETTIPTGDFTEYERKYMPKN